MDRKLSHGLSNLKNSQSVGHLRAISDPSPDVVYFCILGLLEYSCCGNGVFDGEKNFRLIPPGEHFPITVHHSFCRVDGLQVSSGTSRCSNRWHLKLAMAQHDML